MRKAKQSFFSKTFLKQGRSRYSPHQGEKEMARRRKQIEKGMLIPKE